jgi:hypothetical protein
LKVNQRAILRKNSGYAGGFGAPRIRAGPCDDGDFIEDDCGVFDEHRIGQVPRGWSAANLYVQGSERIFIGGVLLNGAGNIDRLAREVG